MPARIEGDEIAMAFNVRYLLEGLKAMPDAEVRLNLNTPTSPAVLSAADADASGFTYLVMPVQIRS